MSAEFWAIIGVGVALAGMLLRQSIEISRIHRDIADLRERLARIEGWIAGRFREESV